MATPRQDEVTLHLKTERVTRDRLLGALRARGTTMQQFFDTLMHVLVTHPDYLDEIDGWVEADDPAYTFAAASSP